MAGQKFVVVPRDIDDPGPFARFAQNFLDDVVMLLRPVDSPAQRPDVEQVTHNVERVEVVLFQEREDGTGVATPRAQMDIGNPPSTIALRAIGDHDPFVVVEKTSGKSSNVTFSRQMFPQELPATSGLTTFRTST